MSAVRRTPREIVLLMAREIDAMFEDEPDPESEDEEYIHEWVPKHRHGPEFGGPDCAACWLHDYDRAISGAMA